MKRLHTYKKSAKPFNKTRKLSDEKKGGVTALANPIIAIGRIIVTAAIATSVADYSSSLKKNIREDNINLGDSLQSPNKLIDKEKVPSFPTANSLTKIPDDWLIENPSSINAEFLATRSGLNLSSGVDRLIFKNQTFLDLLQKDYLFNKGYFGSIEEYLALLKSNNSVLYSGFKYDDVIYPGTQVTIDLNPDAQTNRFTKKKLLYARANRLVKDQYVVEYKKKMVDKNASLTSSLKRLSGVTEFAEIENAREKEYLEKKDLNQLESLQLLKRPNIQFIKKDEVTANPLQRGGSTFSNPYYKIFEELIPANMISKYKPDNKGVFYKLNDEINIPFENKKIFAVFHLIKYHFRKMFTVFRVNLLYHLLKSFSKSMKQNVFYNDTLKGMKNSNILSPEQIEIFKKALSSFSKKEQEKERQEANLPNKDLNIGGKKTKKRHHKHNNKTKKRGAGLQAMLSKVKGDRKKGNVLLIAEKLSKYLFCKNLRMMSDDPKENSIAESQQLYYVEEEQKRFLGLAIMYFKTKKEERQNDYYYVFMEPNPFHSYTNPSENKLFQAAKNQGNNANTAIDNFLKRTIEITFTNLDNKKYPMKCDLSKKSAYQLMHILADLVYPENAFSENVSNGETDFSKDFGHKPGLWENNSSTNATPSIPSNDNMSNNGALSSEQTKSPTSNNYTSNNQNDAQNQNNRLLPYKKPYSLFRGGENHDEEFEQNGGIFGIPNMGIGHTVNRGLQTIGESVFEKNMKLNMIFDYSFKRMVHYRIKDLYYSVETLKTLSENDTKKNSNVIKNIYKTILFYKKIKHCCAMSSHIQCTSAINTTLGAIATVTNPLTPSVILVAATGAIPPWLIEATNGATPHCIVSLFFGIYSLLMT